MLLKYKVFKTKITAYLNLLMPNYILSCIYILKKQKSYKTLTLITTNELLLVYY